jgi:hypothetical protein
MSFRHTRRLPECLLFPTWGEDGPSPFSLYSLLTGPSAVPTCSEFYTSSGPGLWAPFPEDAWSPGRPVTPSTPDLEWEAPACVPATTNP